MTSDKSTRESSKCPDVVNKRKLLDKSRRSALSKYSSKIVVFYNGFAKFWKLILCIISASCHEIDP